MRSHVIQLILWTILAHAPVAFASGNPAPATAVIKALAEVPFTLHQNAIIVEATINGRDKVQLLLDTGWGPLAMVSTAATRLGLHPQGAAGEFPLVSVDSLVIGGAVKRNATFEVFPTEELAPLIGPYDGVLSTAFFRDLVLQVDYPVGVVRFYASSPIPASSPADANTRASVPMIALVGALPFTDAVWLDGTPVRTLFDTGGSGGFMATQRLVARDSLETLPDTGSNVGIGMLSDGKMTQQRIQFAKVGRIELGPFVVDSPRVIIAPSQLEGDNWGHHLIVGYGFMRNYVVTFDYPGKTITLQR